MIPPDSRETIISNQDIGCEALLRLIRMMSVEQQTTGGKESNRVYNLTLAEVEGLVDKPIVLKSYSNCHRNSQIHLAFIREWIDLSLHLNFVKNFPADCEERYRAI